MKDAKGHGSDPRGAAHQTGVEQATAPGPRFSNDVRDAYRGDIYGSIRAENEGKYIGHLDYVAGYESGSSSGRPIPGMDRSHVTASSVHTTHVHMLETDPSARRHGVATGMVDKLKQEFPGTRIKWGMRTPEGQAFVKGYYGKRK